MGTPILKSVIAYSSPLNAVAGKVASDDAIKDGAVKQDVQVSEGTTVVTNSAYADKADMAKAQLELQATISATDNKATGVISTHLCSHANNEPPSEWVHCRDDPKSEYAEEFI